MKRNKKWNCIDCKKDTRYEHFYLKNEVWNKIHNSNCGMICINCCENRLERKLNKNDFTDCYINQLNYGKKCIELIRILSNE